MEDLLSAVPSTGDSGKTLWDDIKEFNEEQSLEGQATTHVLAQGNGGLEELNMKKSVMNLKDRMDLITFMLEPRRH